MDGFDAIFSNDPYKLHNVVKLNGYDLIEYNGSKWLKILHQNSRVRYFNDANANYSIDKNCFSILSQIDDKFRISNGTANAYSLMIELPQIPQHIRWHQYSYFTDTSNTSIGYLPLLDTNGSWPGFGGIHTLKSVHSWKVLYVCQNNGVNWHYPIGCKFDEYKTYIPFMKNAV